MKKSFWVSMTIATILVIFSVLNADTVDVNILFREVEISLAILLIIVFLSGVIAGASYFYIKTKRKSKESSIDGQSLEEASNTDAEN